MKHTLRQRSLALRQLIQGQDGIPLRRGVDPVGDNSGPLLWIPPPDPRGIPVLFSPLPVASAGAANPLGAALPAHELQHLAGVGEREALPEARVAEQLRVHGVDDRELEESVVPAVGQDQRRPLPALRVVRAAVGLEREEGWEVVFAREGEGVAGGGGGACACACAYVCGWGDRRCLLLLLLFLFLFFGGRVCRGV